MRDILRKEMKLSASMITYLFILFGLLFLVPGYPVLCSAFFVCLGIFQSFQNARESNDIVFSVLLPIAKKDVVKGKYIFVCLIEACGFLFMILSVLIRMTVFRESAVYRANALMNANLFALANACIIFGLFNLLFVGGFFRTACKFARPFVSFIAGAFAVIVIAETLHHVPGLEMLNAFGFEHFAFQVSLLAGGIIISALITFCSYRKACDHFERIDL